MRRLSMLALYSASLMILHAASFNLEHQAPAIAVHLAMRRAEVPIGQEPVAVLTMDNLTDHIVLESNSHYRLHVEGPNGQPPKTMWYRQFLCEPGMPCLTTTLNVGPRSIFPAPYALNSIDWGFQLSAFYDLKRSGKYSVQIEVEDDESGNGLTTNTVPFEMGAPTK